MCWPARSRIAADRAIWPPAESPARQVLPYRAALVHFAVMPYVRESRRVVGLHALTRLLQSSRRPLEQTSDMLLNAHLWVIRRATNILIIDAGWAAYPRCV